jgi:GWxTD domain-containing protein
MPRRYSLLALLGAVLLLLLPSGARAAEAPDWKVPNKDWARGPVHWIMSEEEEKEFKKLKTDEERAAFAKAFWAKRDPTPGTPDNEYEMLFWKKVEIADKTFKAITRPGSLTDMGRSFLLLGKPSKTDKDAKGQSIWTFDPEPTNEVKEHMVLRFAGGDTGGGPMLLDRKMLEQYVAGHAETRGIGWKPPERVLAQGDQAGAPAAPARPAEDTSPESQRQIPILEAALSKGQGPTDIPLQATVDYYAAVDGTTLTSVTVEVPREAAHGGNEAALQVYARLVPAAGDGKPINMTGDSPFVPASPSDSPAGSFVYQCRHNLAPGSYRMAVVVEDKIVKGQTGTLVRTVEVPDYRKTDLDLSSLSLLARFVQSEGDVGPEEKPRSAGAYMLGSFRLVPRANPVLTKDDSLSFYYQVYHPTADPSTGKFTLEETYAFFLKDGEGWKPFRKPLVRTRSGQVELYEIALHDFLVPNQKLPAEFRMDVKVVDKVSGKEATRSLTFSVR